jgi:hypothetical protein
VERGLTLEEASLIGPTRSGSSQSRPTIAPRSNPPARLTKRTGKRASSCTACAVRCWTPGYRATGSCCCTTKRKA